MSEYMTSYFNEGNGGRVVYNPLRPYYTPGLHHQHNYTSLPSNDTIPGHTPEVFDHEETPFKNTAVKFASFAAFKYFMTMCTSPFDVGTTLLQVQYAPHQSVEVFAVSNGATTTTTSTAHNVRQTGYMQQTLVEKKSEGRPDDIFLFLVYPFSKKMHLPRKTKTTATSLAVHLQVSNSNGNHSVAVAAQMIIHMQGACMMKAAGLCIRWLQWKAVYWIFWDESLSNPQKAGSHCSKVSVLDHRGISVDYD